MVKNKLVIILFFFSFFYILIPMLFKHCTGDIANNLHIKNTLIIFPPIASILVLGYYLKSNFININDFKKIPIWTIIKKYFFCSLIILPISFIWLGILEYLKFDIHNVAIKKLFLTANSSTLIILIVAAVIVAPVVEEIIFRKLIFEELRQTIGDNNSIYLTAALFAVAHFNFVQIIPLFLLGVFFQKLYLKYSLPSAIFAHFLNNAISVTLLLLLKTLKI